MLAYRHEQKYLLDAMQQELLLIRCRCALRPDPHAQADGTYLIRSLYFDDPWDTCLQENLSGTDRREKYRIRMYRGSGIIRLERKDKLHGLTHKESCTLTREECLRLMRGETPEITPDQPPARRQLLLGMQLGHMQPKVIVTYERVPFVCEAGNVRVTFDRKITSSSETDRFLENSYTQRPVFPTGTCLLEVKWDEALPVSVGQLLQTDGLRRTAFSKYTMCRVYSV